MMLDRRAFLAVTALSGAMAQSAGLRGTSDAAEPFPGLILREREPLNLEFPFATLKDVITPVESFFVRSHFNIPQLDAATWKLRIGGAVQNPVELSYDDLLKMGSTTQAATIECAGNGRAFLIPKAKGVLWETGAVGNAEWTGVSLNKLLEHAGVKQDAVEVIFTGADRGEITEEPKSPGKIHFERSLPIAKAKSAEVLIAFAMNGKPLTAEHGFPARVIVPGWYGMASVKWLTEITVVTTSFHGFWQTLEYSYFEKMKDRSTLVPVTELQVKASIARPAQREVVPTGKSYRVFGAAWAGEEEVTKVEVSTDAGTTWHEASFVSPAVPFSWRLWEWDWSVPQKPQKYRLMVKATDRRGRTQPTERDANRRGYMVNHLVPVDLAST